MDNAWELQLNAQTLTDTNNVWLHLHVNTLLEITNHTATNILQSFYHDPKENKNDGNKSSSTLQLPNQPSPGETSHKQNKRNNQPLWATIAQKKQSTCAQKSGLWKSLTSSFPGGCHS